MDNFRKRGYCKPKLIENHSSGKTFFSLFQKYENIHSIIKDSSLKSLVYSILYNCSILFYHNLF